MIEETVNTLRKILGDDPAQISINIVGGIQFGDGYAAKEFAELFGLQLKPGDVIQGKASDPAHAPYLHPCKQ